MKREAYPVAKGDVVAVEITDLATGTAVYLATVTKASKTGRALRVRVAGHDTDRDAFAYDSRVHTFHTWEAEAQRLLAAGTVKFINKAHLNAALDALPSIN